MPGSAAGGRASGHMLRVNGHVLRALWCKTRGGEHLSDLQGTVCFHRSLIRSWGVLTSVSPHEPRAPISPLSADAAARLSEPGCRVGCCMQIQAWTNEHTFTHTNTQGNGQHDNERERDSTNWVPDKWYNNKKPRWWRGFVNDFIFNYTNRDERWTEYAKVFLEPL